MIPSLGRAEMPDAKFLVVDLYIRNNDRTASTFPPVKLVDAQGREYDQSSKGTFMPGVFDSFKQLNPGVSSRGYVVFDVPSGQYLLLLSGGFESGEHTLVDLSPAPQGGETTSKPSPAPVEAMDGDTPKGTPEVTKPASEVERSEPADSDTTGNQGSFTSGTVWTSLMTGNDWKIREDGDFLYVERINIPPEVKADGAFIRDELKKGFDGKWRGRARSLLPCEYQGAIKYCKHELDFEIDLLSDKRIEGIAMDEERFDCGKCASQGAKQIPFTWIPK
jgi:hypothetical protein